MNLKKLISSSKEWIKAIIIAFFIIIFIKTFIVEIYSVSSTSMEKTLLSGDFIIVNKLKIGPRFPMTLLAIPFTHNTFPFSNSIKSYLSFLELPYFRIHGFSDIDNNDILIFNNPLDSINNTDKKEYEINRCVGLPGETINIINKRIYINDDLIYEPENIQYSYYLRTRGFSLRNLNIDGLDISEGGPVNDKGEYTLMLTKTIANQLRKNKEVFSLKLIDFSKEDKNESLFSPNNLFWNLDYYGPLFIPKKNKTITLTSENINLYKKIIINYENNSLKIVDNSIIINGIKTNSYTFKMNYYFVVGDNRHSSLDSRYWGFLPENHIVGKVSTVLFSIDKTKGFFSHVRWSRIFKSIN